MTSRLNKSSGGNTRSDARSNEELSSEVDEEGCLVIEESGTVCGETRALNIFQEFRQIYDECLRKMEGNKEENLALRKLAPFRKLVEDLWEQNAMLVETVEELEQEATCRVALLQNKLDECSEKVAENLNNMNELVNAYLEDIGSLVEVIRRFRENGKLNSDGLKFNTVCDDEIFGVNGKRGNLRFSDECSEETPIIEKESCKDEIRNESTSGTNSGTARKTTGTSRSISCQSDLSPSAACSACCNKPDIKRARKTFGCRKKLKQPSGITEADSKMSCSPRIDHNQKFQVWNVQTLDETDENKESFHSAIDCSKICEHNNISCEYHGKLLPVLNENPELCDVESHSLNCTSYNRLMSEDTCPNCTRPINISLQFISESMQQQCSDCHCDCTFCGC